MEVFLSTVSIFLFIFGAILMLSPGFIEKLSKETNKVLFTIAILAILNLPCLADTYISGHITENTTWGIFQCPNFLRTGNCKTLSIGTTTWNNG